MLVIHLQKNIERIQKFMQTGNTNYIYKNDLDKACFQYDWLMVTIKMWLNIQNQIKCSEIKHLKLQVIQNMMDMKKD